MGLIMGRDNVVGSEELPTDPIVWARGRATVFWEFVGSGCVLDIRRNGATNISGGDATEQGG